MLLRAMAGLVSVYHSMTPGRPSRSELGNQDPLKGQRQPMNAGNRTRTAPCNLISTSDGFVFPESFSSYGRQGIASNKFIFDGQGWLANHTQEHVKHKGLYLFIGILSKHFGHFLVDSLSQLWPLILYHDDLVKRIDGFVVFSGHALSSNSAVWPDFIPETLGCLSIPKSRIILVDKPMSFERCLIPRKISPFGCGGGRPYNATMQAISNQIKTKSYSNIYLSRSLLNSNRKDNDCMENEVEAVFRDRGFIILHPQTMPLSEQARMISRATRIAGCIGSQLHLIGFNDQANLNVFRICPDYFAPMIDSFICAGISDTARVTDYKVTCPTPDGLLHQAPFIHHLDLIDLAAKVDEWLQMPQPGLDEMTTRK
jgi:hypothetical protein